MNTRFRHALNCFKLSFLMCFALASVAHATPEEDLVLKIKAQAELLSERVPNAFGAQIPLLDTPAKVEAVVDEIESLMTQAARNKVAYDRPIVARTAVLEALMMLYKGRGNTAPKDGTGWYLVNRSGATGLQEIERILGKSLLDEEGKKRFAEFVREHDFRSAQVKTSAGFPPAFDIGSDDIKNRIAMIAESAPASKPYESAPQTVQKLLNTQELIEEAMGTGKLKDPNSIKDFVGALETNHYDKSVATLNSSDKKFVNYFGRQDEMKQIVNALSKLEKPHVLLTGKAGVGKTTILKMLSDAFVQGKQSIHNEPAPMILELPITAVTNPSDPSAIKNFVNGAKFMSEKLGRRVIIYVDEAHISTSMTRNALKGFLTDMVKATGDAPKVNMVFATTSTEAREFLQDTAFSRRWSQVNAPEFNRDQTLQLIKQSYVDLWKDNHQKKGLKFDGISDEAFDYAYKYAGVEQPHAGNPTGTKEILEGALVSKLNREVEKGTTGAMKIDVADIQKYIQENLKMALLPGDPEFDHKFSAKWNDFNSEYVGNAAAKVDLEQTLKSHFNQMKPNKMTALSVFGPPGGGKTYGAEQIAKHFFNGAMLTINGAEFKNGGLELNKLIGSPTGTVGSEQQRSILTKFLADNPNGGVIKIEESDYMHQDVIQLFTNMITDKKFTDGLGKEWDTSKFVLWSNSNIGQDLMIPSNSKNRMSWEQFDTRRRALTETASIGGHEIERVKPAKLAQVFDHYIETIVAKSNPNGDTSAVSQEANKQRRRWKPLYILPPDKQELLDSAYGKVANYIRDAKLDHGVNFDIPKDIINTVLDVENYDFEKGYSYVNDQLEDKLFRNLSSHLRERGKSFSASLHDTEIDVGNDRLPAHELVIKDAAGGAETRHSLGAVNRGESNPWGDNPEMMQRIRNFSRNMSKNIKGNTQVIEGMKEALKLKASDWNTRPVFSLLGTSGNGKTETFKSMAKELFGSDEAMFKISGLNHPYDLANYFRPPTGVQGGMQETEFERWFKSRMNSGGGVILFDELLSLDGMDNQSRGHRIEVINMLYDLLDEGFLKIGNKKYDARGFVIGITGNTLQDLFAGIGDDPDSERLVQEITKRLGRQEIVQSLGQHGIDPPKAARFGFMWVMGPQPKKVTQDVGLMKVAKVVQAIQARERSPMEIAIDPEIVHGVSDQLSTNKLGMREVERGQQKLIMEPINNIISDIHKSGIEKIKKIEAKLNPDKTIQWLVNGKPVDLEGFPLDEGGLEERNWNFTKSFDPKSHNRTPQLKDIGSANKVVYSPEALKSVAAHEVYGHWMVNTLLNRKNNAAAISLIPGDGHLGYVRHAIPDTHEMETLSTLFKKAVVLDAGHRALFAAGIYATGGGNSGGPRDPSRPGSDDLAQMNQIFDKMIHNRLLPDVSEGSSPSQKAVVKEYLRVAIDRMADEMIHEGVKSGAFSEVYKKAISDRFLNQEYLDGFVKKAKLESFGHPEEYFLGKLGKALNYAATASGESEAQAKVLKGFGSDLLDRLHTESGRAVAHEPALLKKLEVHRAAGPKKEIPPHVTPIENLSCREVWDKIIGQ